MTSAPFSLKITPLIRALKPAGLLTALLLVLPRSSAESPSLASFYLPTTGVAVERQVMLLAIDDYLLPLKENVGSYLSKPDLHPQPVVLPSRDNPLAADQIGADMYGSVLYDGGKYRMWYNGDRLRVPGDAYHPDMAQYVAGPICYAESQDGIHWTKPNLGQFEVRGSTANNGILVAGAPEQNEAVFVLKDEVDPNPSRRYKLVFNPRHPSDKYWIARTATSPDGIHWTAGSNTVTDQFIEPAGLHFFNGLYAINGQRMSPSEGGHASGRQGRAILSPDFDHWLPGDVDAFLLPEPNNPSERGDHKPYDQVHLGVGAASFGNVMVGFYGLWHNLPGEENPKQRWSWFPFGKLNCDLGLVISNDGLHFREPVKGKVYISHAEAPATPVPGKNYPTCLTQSGNAILNVGDKTLIYFGRWLNADYNQGMTTEISLATLPRDRWGALGLFPKDSTFYRKHGSVWSAPVRIPVAGCRVVLNADHADRMTVEVSDAKFHLLPDYSGPRSGHATTAGGLDCGIAWPAEDLSALGGRTVRFKMNFDEEGGASPRLYAVYLRSK